jgi:wyosine [tRNA(Phe)-imidazoG37] synthetase (radical SAM superfamily)
VTEIALSHIKRAERPIVSFGQGCEGEPLLQAELLEEAVTRIRAKTGQGTINLNSNASLPDAVQRLAHAGLDSIRVSLNSAQETCYTKYYRPSGYSFSDVKQSIRIMKECGRFVSLNYFILPGFTDSGAETSALLDLLDETRPDYIQLRNLNMDPEWYIEAIGSKTRPHFHGVRKWLATLKTEFPQINFGYFNPYLVN